MDRSGVFVDGVPVVVAKEAPFSAGGPLAGMPPDAIELFERRLYRDVVAVRFLASPEPSRSPPECKDVRELVVEGSPFFSKM